MKDSVVEKWLSTRSVKWEYMEKVSMDSIDIPAGLRNQARIQEPIKEETVRKYMIELPENVFPPIALRKVAVKLVSINGNRRIVAAQRLGWNEYPYGAYVVTCSDVDFDILARTANLTNGDPLPEEDRTIHAGQLVLNTGMTCKDAAIKFSVSLGAVELYVASRKIDKRSFDCGVRGIDKLSATARVQINKIQSDKLFGLAIETAKDPVPMTGEEAGKFAHEIMKAKSEESALSIIENERKRRMKAAPHISSEKSKVIAISRKIKRACDSITNIQTYDVRLLSGELAKSAREQLSSASIWIKELRQVR